MVHERDSQQGDADRLDALWDDLIRTGDPTRFSDLDAPFVAYLDALAPRPNSAARARIRRRVFGARQENLMEQPFSLNHPIGHRSRPAPSRSLQQSAPRRRSWWRVPIAAMEVSAAFAVLVAIVVGVWMMRPRGGPSLPAVSTFSSPVSTPREGSDGGSIAALELDSTATDADLSVAVQRVILPPNAGWVFPNGAFPPVPVPASQFVESGTLTVGVRGENHQVAAGTNSKVKGGPQYLLNSNSEPVTFLQILAHVTGTSAPEPPSAVAVTTIADVPVPRSPADSHTVITLNQATYSGAAASAISTVPNPNKQTIFLQVESGELRVYTAGDTGGRALKTGESVTVADGGITDTEILGDTTATVLFLNVQTQDAAERSADDPRAGSTVDWQIPDGGGNVGFLLNRLTLAPAATMSFDVDGAVHIRVVSGALQVTMDTVDKTLSANQRATASGKSHIVIRNDSTQSAVALLGLAYGEWVEAPSITHENRTGQISVTALGAGVTNLPQGPATVSLAPVSVPSEFGGFSSTYLQDGANLIAATQGTILLTRIAGDIDIQHNASNVSATSATVEPANATPQLGRAIKIGVDDSVFIHPHAGYRVELAVDATDPAPQLYVLTVSSAAQPSATPTVNDATPAPAEAFTVAGDAPCTVAPRTMKDLTAILKLEHAAGTPELGLRDHQAAGAPADPDTVGGVRQTVIDLAACRSTGSPLQTYALYSANAIRLMAEANGLTAEDLAVEPARSTASPRMPDMTIAIDTVLTFPDGRAGATVNFDGEIAYLTFVHQGDRWLIDAWDDR